ncbi:Solute carrier family 10 member 6 [Armadillidium vulgare]|nr:Solute carrier family 10 member 6 [Armadillidium vulgare]
MVVKSWKTLKMCPLYPLHLIFSWGFLILFLWIWGGQTLASALEMKTESSIQLLMDQVTVNEVNVNEGEEKTITVFIEDLPPDAVAELLLKKESDDPFSHIRISPEKVPLRYDPISQNYSGDANVSGDFLGFSKIKFFMSYGNSPDDEMLQKEEPLHEVSVKVHRKTTTLDIIFIHVVIGIVLIAYINMGCAIDLHIIKETLKRPVAPAIGLVSQYLFMPLMSFILGYFLFPTRPDFWLGLFFTGCAPGGGGSNMWTYVLEGSLDLSITMTFLSTIFAFAALPLWVYALGPRIFADGYYGKLPYRNIAFLVFGLVVPCGIGLAIRRYFPRVVLAGFCLPFLGFVFGGTVAVLMKRKWEDIVAISIETGVQNTGLAIALGKLSPLDDIAIVMPVAVRDHDSYSSLYLLSLPNI